MRKNFADILKEEEKERLDKIKQKLPSWVSVDGLDYPSSISLEQCSSELAAKHKASLIAQRLKNPRIADVTGGLGVDSLAFSTIAETVLHNEMDVRLSAAAKNNFAKLGSSGNVIFTRDKIGIPDTDGWMKKLENFKPDLIFMDPARRDSMGKKVFLLEDCSPDFLKLRTMLQNVCPQIMLKLSPMADISMLITRIEENLREIHVVSIKGEVKELLCFLDSEIHGEPVITVSEIHPDRKFDFSFTPAEEKKAHAIFCDMLQEGDLLLEPSPGLLKSGCFNLLSHKFGIRKLSASSHLYTGNPGQGSGTMFKSFRIAEIHPFSSEGFKKVGKEHPTAEVIARNVPMSSEQLRSRLKTKPGGDIRIYGCQTCSGRKLIVCSGI